MNQPLFDPQHLRIAAQVRRKAWCRRWLNLTAGPLGVLMMAVVGAMELMVLMQIVRLLGH